MQDIDVESLEDMEVPIRKSTKRPLEKQQKSTEKILKEDLLIDQALLALERKNVTQEDGDDIFGKNVACSLRKISDEQLKEFTKLKIQEILFQARCGSVSQDPFSTSNRFPAYNNQPPSYNYPFQVIQSNSPAEKVYEQ